MATPSPAETTMTILSKSLFFIGLLAFLGALFVAGSPMGDIVWRAGVAILLLVLALVQLWPAPAPSTVERRHRTVRGR